MALSPAPYTSPRLSSIGQPFCVSPPHHGYIQPWSLEQPRSPPEHPSGEQSLHGSGLVPLLLLPTAALVPGGQLSLSPREENSKVVG